MTARIPSTELALLLMKPDAVHQRLDRGITAFLGDRGFRVVRSEAVRITPRTRFRLYRPDRERWNTNWPLGCGLFQLGPVVVLLLRNVRVPNGYESAADYLARGLKGNHVPLQAAPGTIRGDFNAVNPALNLVHAADDAAGVRRELAVLVDWAEDAEVPAGDPPAEQAARPEEAPRLLDFPGLLTGVIDWLLVQRGVDAGLRTEVRSALDAAGGELAAATDRRSRQEAVIAMLGVINELTRHRRDPLVALAAELSSRERFVETDYPSLFSRLAAAGRPLDGWSRYLMQTSMYYLDPDEDKRTRHVQSCLPPDEGSINDVDT